MTSAEAVASEGRFKLDQWLDHIESPPDGSEDKVTSRPPKGPTLAPKQDTSAPRRAAPGRSRRRGGDALRSRDKLVPQRPVDWELAKKIGPVQRYDDDF